ncbi:FMN-binding negative transcriptional regulator [Salinicola aestuarinus]|uniref:FMN-binding negative transcriptional regulator n=1 Tax=Salinicola aestuarinus TaxID=1949082 RepID=UPI000DA11C81|nr:FMN-binding negative transcriptional regulator [Salinicola aestuarinus]
MHQPRQFRIGDPRALAQAIDDAPFATLITSDGDGGIDADHLPLLRDFGATAAAGERLLGHIARANPLAERLNEAGAIEAMAIFHGPQAYITPTWYPAKREHGRVVPTWNYQVVHVHGVVKRIEDADWLLAHLNSLTARFETDQPSPWSVDDAPSDFIARLCGAIVGIELVIQRIDGTRKASQHKSLAEREAIYRGLQVAPGFDPATARTLSGMDDA